MGWVASEHNEHRHFLKLPKIDLKVPLQDKSAMIGAIRNF